MPRKRTNTPENYNAPLPTQLRNLLRASGHTQQELADHLGIKRQSVSAYTDGSANPTPTTIVAIAKFFGVSTDYLLGESTFTNSGTANLTVEDVGLSEKATDILATENRKENKSKLIALNYLIEAPLFLDKLALFLESVFCECSKERPFSLIPYDRREMSMNLRLCFADLLECLPKYKDGFYKYVIGHSEAASGQMIFDLIGRSVSDGMATEWIALLLDSQNSSDIDDQLRMIAKFLIHYGYADFAHRSGCNLGQFIVEDDENAITKTEDD